ncbi:MAG: hypothetical protein K8J09_16090 [Planctomycetes bacterium]|nr:hypothetical protein [Planctomycetota bacterium]MCC7396665.1 hypothetical protein [Planctomycetota bacterium]
MPFRTKSQQILLHLQSLDQRLARIEASLAELRRANAEREETLRRDLDIKRRELEALGAQGLHVLEQLDAAKRRLQQLGG